MIRLDQPALKTIEYQIQQQPGGISFAQGALRIGGVDAAIKNRIAELMQTDAADYYCHSLGILQLRASLAIHLQASHGVALTADNVAVTHGSIGGIAALCLMLLNHRDQVLVPTPTYPAYFNAIAIAKAEAVTVDAYAFMQDQGAARWQFDVEKVIAAITPMTKMIILTHPGNPTGVCLTQAQVEAIAVICQERGIYLLVDEAYDNYFFDVLAWSSTRYVPHNPFLIRLGTFSKSFGMSGWRVGYVVAQPDLIQNLAAIHDGMLACPTVVSQYAALQALQTEGLMSLYSSYVRESRSIALKTLQPLFGNEAVVIAQPEAGFFIFIKTDQADTNALVHDIIKKQGVAVVPGKGFGPNSASFMRLCFARTHDTVAVGCSRIVDYFSC